MTTKEAIYEIYQDLYNAIFNGFVGDVLFLVQFYFGKLLKIKKYNISDKQKEMVLNLYSFSDYLNHRQCFNLLLEHDFDYECVERIVFEWEFR